VPLSELDCKKYCEESEVGLTECRKFCEPPVAPCVYFHSDTYRSLTWDARAGFFPSEIVTYQLSSSRAVFSKLGFFKCTIAMPF
jgi:hypothetical protein